MAFTLTTLSDIPRAGFDEIIDVRAPSEFAEDHLPGAISLPVLSDAERAIVGTLYVQVDRFEARKKGAALVARNAAHHLETALADRPGSWRPLVYCWRGGQRSGSFAAILAQIGWRVEVIEGGYKAYRRLVVDAMHKRPLHRRIVLLDGNTGTAKTDLLARLSARGIATVDLEGLANHRGSVFGRVGDQPSQKAFEGALALALADVPADAPLVLEAESSKIGARLIPPSVWAAMREAPRIRISAPLAARADYLVKTYSADGPDAGQILRLIGELAPMHPAERIEGWMQAARMGAYHELAAGLMEHHYDPRYARSASRADRVAQVEIPLDTLSPDGLEVAADRIARAVRRL